MTTKIEWVVNPDGSPGEAWNPVTGCTKVSPGCKNCYARSLQKEMEKFFAAFVHSNSIFPETSGKADGKKLTPEEIRELQEIMCLRELIKPTPIPGEYSLLEAGK